jgi:hypothetical protein
MHTHKGRRFLEQEEGKINHRVVQEEEEEEEEEEEKLSSGGK